MSSDIRDNLLRVRDAIAAQCQRDGRNESEITLVCVSKTVPVDTVRQAIEAGCSVLGENYVQEAQDKIISLGHAPRWHLIGHLQRNKASRAAQLFDMVQSVDSEKLAVKLDGAALAAGRALEVLIEVNAFGEASKTGLPETELGAVVETVRSLKNLKLMGLMGLPPPQKAEADQRKQFARLRTLWETLPPENRKVLSMGMSADYGAAIAEGSTMIRIGTAIFGARGM
ncbi:MAG: YggS family pyridoxal phosphate-dependent enzyme [Armatimonadetes bacterium]|nr:YggS family pyridoxal phosphate-dependent enzyme [Armatimonadota bacterium]